MGSAGETERDGQIERERERERKRHTYMKIEGIDRYTERYTDRPRDRSRQTHSQREQRQTEETVRWRWTDREER